VPYAEANGLRIHYELAGDGPRTIVLVNGLADDLASWAFQMDALLHAGFQVLRFDNRGVGETTCPSGPYTTRLLARDTKALVDYLQITDFHLLGVSMGGMIAQEYALAFPADLRSVTLASTYASPGPFCSRMFALWADLAPVVGTPTVMRDVTLWAFTREFFESRQEELSEFEGAMQFSSQPLHAYLAQLSAIRTHDLTERLDEIEVPTLVVAGESDILIPVALSKRLAEGIRASRWALTPGGHAAMWEYSAEFNSVVIGFLNEVDAAQIESTH